MRRDTLRLTAGFVARVDVALKVGALEESITVSATPTIDVQSTGAVTVLTRETLEVVPSSRAGIITLMNQSPSVRSQLDVGGSQSNQLPAMRVYGIATQATSWLVLDGVVTTDADRTAAADRTRLCVVEKRGRPRKRRGNDDRGDHLNLSSSAATIFTGDASWEQTSGKSRGLESRDICALCITHPTIVPAVFTAAPTSVAHHSEQAMFTAECAPEDAKSLALFQADASRVVEQSQFWSPINSIRCPRKNGSSLDITRAQQGRPCP